MRKRRGMVIIVIGAVALIVVNALVLTHKDASPAAKKPDFPKDDISKGDAPDTIPEVHENIEDPEPPADTKE